MQQTYFNEWEGKERTWDPEGPPGKRGTFFPTFRDDASRETATGGRLLGVELPQGDLDKALVGLAMLIAVFPEVRDRVVVVQAPCIFSNRESWIERGTADDIPAEVIAFVRKHVSHFGERPRLDQFGRDAIRRKFGLGTSYF